MPLLQLDTRSLAVPSPTFDSEISSVAGDDDETPRIRRWWHYIPFLLILAIIFVSEAVTIKVLAGYYFALGYGGRDVLLFSTHVLTLLTLAFLTISSLIICVVRDPGSLRGPSPEADGAATLPIRSGRAAAAEMESLTAVLLAGPPDDESDPDFNSAAKWCKKCWAPKPERTHHCSVCGRCVLKMDHHCPWLATCVGHWTHTAFLHFLCCVTLLSFYVFLICGHILWIAFSFRSAVDETTAVLSLVMMLVGALFSMSVGSFFLYHVYLVTTNQTTLESLSPFLLLRYLPRTSLPQTPTGQAYPVGRAFPPLIHELSTTQRRRLRRAHARIRLYDVGWRRNWIQVIGWNKNWGWVKRLLYGGGGCGDGKTFPRNSRSQDQLARLAADLFDDDKSA